MSLIKRMTLAVFMMLLLVSTCSTAVMAAEPAATGEATVDVKIAGVRVEGNQKVPTADILAKMKIKSGDTIDKEKVRLDCESILSLGKINEVRPEVRVEDDKAVLVLRIFENPVITEIRFEGLAALNPEQLRGVMATRPGDVLDTAVLRSDIAAVEKLYQDNGYVLARVVDVNITQAGVITLTVAEGVIESIRVDGLTKTRPQVVTREMLLKPGDVFHREKLRLSMQRVFNLGFFEDVTSKVEPGVKPGQVVLVVTVVERKTGMASAGLGYSSKDGLVGSIEVRENNFRGLGQRAAVRFEFGTRQSYEVSFREPWLDKKNTSLEVSLYDTTRERFRETTDAFDESRRGGSLTLGRPLNMFTQAFVTLKAENVSVPDESGYPEGSLRSVALSTVRDTRDVFTNPTSGSRVNLSAEQTGGWLGGDFDFTKYSLDARRYIKMSDKNHVLALRLNAGLGTGTIPVYEQYTLGGAFSLRGYTEDAFIAENILSATAEYRVPVNKSLSAVGFVDAGKVWGPSATDTGFKLGYGAGLRVDTPIGPIRLDYGMGNEGGRIHFSIGQMF